MTSAVAPKFNFHRYNSAYIAALAYDAHTKDMRPDLEGISCSQHIGWMWWKREITKFQYQPTNTGWPRNMADFKCLPVTIRIRQLTPCLEATWWTNGEYVNNDLKANAKRADNFYVAADAERW